MAGTDPRRQHNACHDQHAVPAQRERTELNNDRINRRIHRLFKIPQFSQTPLHGRIIHSLRATDERRSGIGTAHKGAETRLKFFDPFRQHCSQINCFTGIGVEIVQLNLVFPGLDQFV
jgi:hypothetical protein